MRLAVLGDPVAHSRSPAIHAAALAAFGIPGTYEARRVDEDGLAAAFEDLRGGRLDGANVTMPHKAAAARLADLPDAAVRAIGASNTVRGRDGRVEAINTDVPGIADAAAAAEMPQGSPVLVLGGGGAAAAARAAFAGRRVLTSTRSPGEGETSVPWGVPVPGALVVNATPLGMRGETLPPGLVEESAGLVDLAYGEGPTPAAEAARRRGLPVADGLDVLVAQAARSFAWWTGRPAPLEVMARAARSV